MPLSEEYLDFLAKYPSLQAIGNTPLVKLDLQLNSTETEIYAKYEHLNPGGSIKDRPILWMLANAIISGELTKEKVILDATSGNAGIAYAMIGAILGFRVELVMPSNASVERTKRVLAHGAEITFTDSMLGYDETIREVRRKYENNPDKYFYCNQYANQNNPLAHYETTAEEILQQISGITHFVAGVGTGGTISGIGRKLKENIPDIQIVCINFDEWPGVEGLKPLGQGHIVPDTFDERIVDKYLQIDVDEGYQMSKKLALKGIFVGQSAAAYVLASYKIANEIEHGKVITIINDIGERYFSTGVWD